MILPTQLPVNILERVIPAPSQKPGVFLSDRAATSQHTLARSDQLSGVSASEPWRAQLLLHHQMDLNTMEQKTIDCRYKTIYDFEIDALTIVHNVVIYQGGRCLFHFSFLSIFSPWIFFLILLLFSVLFFFFLFLIIYFLLIVMKCRDWQENAQLTETLSSHTSPQQYGRHGTADVAWLPVRLGGTRAVQRLLPHVQRKVRQILVL